MVWYLLPHAQFLNLQNIYATGMVRGFIQDVNGQLVKRSLPYNEVNSGQISMSDR
jgi:hypothetical protein